MFSPQFSEYLTSGADTAVSCVVKTLPDGLEDIGLRSDIEKSLIGLCILNDGFRLSIDGEGHRPFCLLKALHE
jgi:hypothetical protein